MTDSFDKNRAFGKLGFDGEIEIDPTRLAELREAIFQGMEEDLKAKIAIQHLLMTEDTFEHSLGALYSYLSDKKVCSSCPGDLQSCPKKRAGFVLTLSYDEKLDEIKTLPSPCPYQRELEKSLSNIRCSSIPEGMIYKRAVSLQREVERHPDKKDLNNGFEKILDCYDKFRNGSEFRGALFVSTLKNDYPTDLLAFACYLFAKFRYSCCFVDLDSLSFLSNKNYVLSRNVRLDLDDYASCDALFLLDIERLPIKSEELCSALEWLIDERTKKGRITFATSTQNNPFSSWRSLLWGRDGAENRVEKLKDLLPLVLIRDFE